MTISIGGAEIAVIISMATVITLAVCGAVGCLMWRARLQDAPGRPVRALPVSRVPPAGRPVLEETYKRALEPSRVIGPHRVPLSPGQLTAISRRGGEKNGQEL